MPSSKLSFNDLVDLLGRPIDAPAVLAMIEALDAQKSSDYIIAKAFGVEYALESQVGSKKKVLVGMFLHGPRDKPKRPPYAGLPAPFAFSTREQLRDAKQPDEAWTLDEGKVPLTHPASERDSWNMDGYTISAKYRGDATISNYYVKQTKVSAEPLLISPLHFETQPVDAPPGADLIGPALVVAWATARFGPSAKHANTEAGRQLAKRAISPVTFFETACKSELSTLDFDPKLHEFLHGYIHQVFTGTRAPNREDTAELIAKLWGFEEPDTRYFGHDYEAAFRVLGSLYYVPDSWEAVDRLGSLLDARWADFEATGFKQPPDLARYEAAAKARDAITLVPRKKQLAAQTRDDALTTDLLGLIGKSLKDPAVKPIFARAGLPIGKRIDEQANPELGIVYLGTNTKTDGKSVLIIEYVRFHSTGESASVRGLGKSVTFAGYPNALPGGLMLGASRAAVVAAYGPPATVGDNHDLWYPAANQMIAASYDANGNLANIKFGAPPSWVGTPAPPYSPVGWVTK